MVDERSNTDFSIFVLDVASGDASELTPHDVEVKFLPGPWLPDGSGFHLVSDDGREFQGLARFDLASGAVEWVETPEADVEELAGSADGRVIAWLENVDGWARLRLRDLASGQELPAPQLPDGTVSDLAPASPSPATARGSRSSGTSRRGRRRSTSSTPPPARRCR